MRHLGDARIEAMALSVAASIDAAAGLRIRDRGLAVGKIAAGLKAAFQVDQDLDRAVRTRIESLRRRVAEGSREWDLLYRQYLEELSRRRR